MDVDTFRSVVLLIASALMSATVAVWLSWTRNRREDRLQDRAELLAAIDQTKQNWHARLRWVFDLAAGHDASAMKYSWGGHIYPNADDGLIGDPDVYRASAEFEWRVLELRTKAKGDSDWVGIERRVMDAIGAQRKLVRSGKPIRRISRDELDAIDKAAKERARSQAGPTAGAARSERACVPAGGQCNSASGALVRGDNEPLLTARARAPGITLIALSATYASTTPVDAAAGRTS